MRVFYRKDVRIARGFSFTTSAVYLQCISPTGQPLCTRLATQRKHSCEVQEPLLKPSFALSSVASILSLKINRPVFPFNSGLSFPLPKHVIFVSSGPGPWCCLGRVRRARAASATTRPGPSRGSSGNTTFKCHLGSRLMRSRPRRTSPSGCRSSSREAEVSAGSHKPVTIQEYFLELCLWGSQILSENMFACFSSRRPFIRYFVTKESK